MHPFRAFLLSLTSGFALLMSGHGLVAGIAPALDLRIGSGPLQLPTA
jgi:hypothetical protein